MYIVPIACVLFGCFQDIPVIVGNNGGWQPYLSIIGEQFKKEDTSSYSCYVNGTFHSICPTPDWKQVKTIKGKPWEQ